MTYRAAMYTEPRSVGVVLTAPEHAALSDADLIAEAMAEAGRAGLFGGEDKLTEAEFRARVIVGEWTE